MKPIEYIRQAFYKGLVSYLVAPARSRRHALRAPAPRGPAGPAATGRRDPGRRQDPVRIPGLPADAVDLVACGDLRRARHHADPAHCIVEADVEAGVRFITLAELADHDIQVVRASRLPETSRQELIDYLLARVGLPYDLNHVIELAGWCFSRRRRSAAG